jgi:hypothetical protein
MCTPLRSLALLLSFCAAASSAPEVFLVNSLSKIRPDEAVPSSAVVSSIQAARNEYESVQVAVSVPTGESPVKVAWMFDKNDLKLLLETGISRPCFFLGWQFRDSHPPAAVYQYHRSL